MGKPIGIWSQEYNTIKVANIDKNTKDRVLP